MVTRVKWIKRSTPLSEMVSAGWCLSGRMGNWVVGEKEGCKYLIVSV